MRGCGRLTLAGKFNLERLLEAHEALLERREGDAKSAALRFIPAGADAEPGAAAGQHIQAGDDLDQEAGVAIVDTCRERAQRDAAGHTGQKRQYRVPLQHGQLRRANHADLEVVVHHGE